MNCPYCEKEMDEGYIQNMGLAKMDMGWYPKDGGFLSVEERLTTSKAFSGRKVAAYRCRNCRKMVIEF
ncbi:MAG: hypothetical protein IJ396_05920 [Oscillibacter sp.]|nr:hypothetical protein [Oscillibacter sp.]